MTRYLVTGASGFVGRHLTALLDQQGRDYACLKRTDDAASVQLPDGNFEVVFHLAGLAHVINKEAGHSAADYAKANCDFAVQVATAAASRGLKQFIYLSSASVYGQTSATLALSESAPESPQDDYGKSKVVGERALFSLSKAMGFELVILRPPVIYGYDSPANIGSLLKGISALPVIPVAERNNKRSFIYVGNLVDFLLFAADNHGVGSGTYNIADHEPISTNNLMRWLNQGMGKKTLIFSLPKAIWRFALSLINRDKMYQQLFESLVLDTSLLEKKYNWTPKFSSREALIATGEKYIREGKPSSKFGEGAAR